MPKILGELGVKVGAKTTDFTRGMGEVLDITKKVNTKLVALGAGFAALGGAIAVFGKGALGAAADFESGMTRVAAVSGATAKEFRAMEAAAISQAERTKFSATEVTKGMQFMAMAGADTKQVMDGIPAVLDLAAAGAIDLGSASNIVTNIMSGFQIEMKDLAATNDVLIKTITSTNTDVSALGQAFKFVGPVAKSAGVEFEELSAAIGVLGNVGVPAGQAGRTLKQAISKLVKPGAKAKAVMRDLGISVLDSEGRLKSLTEIIRQLEPHADNTAAILEIFGLIAGPGMAGLIGQGADALGGLTDKLRNAQGITKRIAEAEMNTFAGQVDILGSKLESLAIGIGKHLIEPVKTGVKWIGELVDRFNKLDESTKQTVVAVGALTALTTALTGLGLAIKAVLPLLAAFAIPLLKIVAIGAAVGAAIAAIIATVGVFAKHWESLWSWVKSVASNVAEFMGGVFDGVTDKVSGFIDSVKDFVAETISLMKQLLMAGGRFVAEKLFGVDPKDFDEIVDKIGDSASDLFGGLKKGAKNAADVINKRLDKTVDGVKEVFAADSDAMSKDFGSASKKIGKAWDTVADGIKKGWEEIKEGFAKGVEVTGLEDLLQQFEDAFAAPAAPDLSPKKKAGAVEPSEDVARVDAAAKARQKFNAQLAANNQQLVGAGGELTSRMGEVGSILSNVAQAFSQGGPIAAAGAAIVEILGRTQTFQQIGAVLAQVLDVLVQQIDKFIQPILPLVVQLADLAAFAFKLVSTFNVVAVAIKLLGEAAKIFAKGVEAVVNGIRGFILFFLKGLRDFLAMVKVFRKRIFGSIVDKLSDTIRDLEKKIKVPQQEAAKAADDVTSSSRDLAASLKNVPTGFKIAAARMAAAQPGLIGSAAAIDAPAGMTTNQPVKQTNNTIQGDLIVQTQRPEDVMAALEDAFDEDRNMRQGSVARFGGPFSVNTGISRP